jgi:hypothetical protein
MAKNSYQFKITFLQNIRLLIPMFAVYILIIIAAYFIKFDLFSKGFIYVFIILFLTDTLPTLIIYFQYWLKNKGQILNINTENREIEYKAPEKTLNYSFSDIASLSYFRSYGKGSGWHSFSQFRYYEINLKDENKITITCLMINDIESTLENLLRTKAAEQVRIACFI